MKTNKELAAEMCDCLACKNYTECKGNGGDCGAFHAVLRMASYKDQELVNQKRNWMNMVNKWFREHGKDFIVDDGGAVTPYIEDECFEKFKTEMEAQL